mgnify:CR=1 FL=1
MWASFGILTVVPWILFAQSHWDMETVPGFLASRRAFDTRPEILDRAGVFTPDAVSRALDAARRLRNDQPIPIRVETTKSLNGAWIADVAHQRARMARSQQLYILLAREEREVGVVAARSGPISRLTDQDRERIRRAFLEPLEAGEFDQALERGIRSIGSALNASIPPRRGLNSQDGIISLAIIAGLLFLFAYQSRDRSSLRWLRSRMMRRERFAPPLHSEDETSGRVARAYRPMTARSGRWTAGSNSADD